ncbi:glycine zipper family protein [Mucilaginibacter conchicola]|uniref:Glycine zipper family protein n=1 Tax=Mucilaginibacter conchicola TaxID=2303333 RepID=A0A372NQ84_9SPHI|nr:glycine zipper family protein [Mucilaginibacter conchicola]
MVLNKLVRRTYFAIAIAVGVAIGIASHNVAIGIGFAAALGILFAGDGSIKR